MGELDAFKSYRIVCTSKAQHEFTSVEITEIDIEILIDLLRELKAHENEIRKVRQELETQIQRYKIRKIMSYLE